MKNILVILAIIAGLNSSTFAQTPVAKNGPLHVENGKIVNQHGAEPQLRGISFSWSIWEGRKYYNPQVVDWLVKDFKVSLIRVAMAVQPAHGYLEQPDSQKNLVTNLAQPTANVFKSAEPTPSTTPAAFQKVWSPPGSLGRTPLVDKDGNHFYRLTPYDLKKDGLIYCLGEPGVNLEAYCNKEVRLYGEWGYHRDMRQNYMKVAQVNLVP